MSVFDKDFFWTAWDTTSLEFLWKLPAQLYWQPEFSPDAKRIIWYMGQNGHLTVINARAGESIRELPTTGRVIWVDRSATRLITAENDILTQWGVDHFNELRRIDLLSADTEEMRRDTASLEGVPSAPVLLEIAHRQLRTCDGAVKAKLNADPSN